MNPRENEGCLAPIVSVIRAIFAILIIGCFIVWFGSATLVIIGFLSSLIPFILVGIGIWLFLKND